MTYQDSLNNVYMELNFVPELLLPLSQKIFSLCHLLGEIHTMNDAEVMRVAASQLQPHQYQ